MLRRMYNEQPGQSPVPDFGVDQSNTWLQLDSDFERQVSQDYKNEVKKKEQEIQQLQKSLLRDSMRIAFNELGRTHYNFGQLQDAIKAWVKSHDFSTQEEDLFGLALQIAQVGLENNSANYVVKYSGEADARDKLKNPSKTIQIKVLDGLGSIMNENYF